jgi:hypothetical protein
VDGVEAAAAPLFVEARPVIVFLVLVLLEDAVSAFAPLAAALFDLAAVDLVERVEVDAGSSLACFLCRTLEVSIRGIKTRQLQQTLGGILPK